jgi:hypothetical protein
MEASAFANISEEAAQVLGKFLLISVKRSYARKHSFATTFNLFN